MLRGFECITCGWIGPKAKTRSSKNVKYHACQECGAPAKEWEKPLNQRPGRCPHCANAKFLLRIENHELIRTCEHCGEERNPETNERKRSGDDGRKFNV